LATTTRIIGLMYLGISPGDRNNMRDESYPVYGF
jgi:hypothetical protein